MSFSQKHAPPYLRAHRRTLAIMSDVCVSLTPSSVAAVWFFGLRAMWMLLTAVGVSFVTDRLSARLHGASHPFDGSALVTGMILALSYLSGYALPHAVSSATPLSGGDTALIPLLFGRVNGSIGETSAVLILLGAAYLLIRRVIRWQIPVLSVAAFAFVIALDGGDVLRHILSGSLLFGAVYIFTDYTGSPTTPLGEILFAVGVGALTAVLRLWGRYPEGVCFAVLIMNLLTPLLDRLTRPRVYGTKRKERSA